MKTYSDEYYNYAIIDARAAADAIRAPRRAVRTPVDAVPSYAFCTWLKYARYEARGRERMTPHFLRKAYGPRWWFRSREQAEAFASVLRARGLMAVARRRY